MYKQVIIVRSDLKLSRGKTAAQAAHASVSVLDKISKTKLSEWKDQGQKKIVLSAKDLKEMIEIKKECEKNKIPTSMITDAGLTEIEPGTITALAIGPDKEDKIDKITGKLPLLK